jgi:tetratricopeptide (TPR) repeat protein
VFVYISSHSEQISLARANYYLSNNNTEAALKYYEQAFEQGSEDTKARYNYITLLLDTSSSTETQEKLEKFIKYPVDDGARYKASSFLSDLRYDIHRKYPDNYVSQGTYNQKVIRWSENPITYGFKNADKAPEYFVSQIETALEVWETELNGKVSFKKAEHNPNIIICFNEKATEAEKEEKYVVAITKPVITGNALKNMVMDFYLTSPDGEYFTENQVYNTALHEIGHALGFMGHSEQKRNVMHMSTDTKTVTNDLRKKLTNSDINTMKLWYSIKPDITDGKYLNGEYIKYLVLGNETEVVNAKLREARTYIKKAPNLPAGYIDLADSFVSMQEYAKAAKCLNKALSLATDNETLEMIYYNLSLTHFLMKDYDSAIEYYNKSGNLKNTESSLHLLAQIYNAAGKKHQAIDIFEDLISKNPSNIEYVIALTNIYVRDNELMKARAVLKRYISKNPYDKHNPRLAPYGIIRMFL